MDNKTPKDSFIIPFYIYLTSLFLKENESLWHKDRFSEMRKIIDLLDLNGKQLGTESIENCIKACEERIKDIVKKHSYYTLLFWMRRLAPNNIFDVEETTVHLYRDVMTLAIFKYGKAGGPVKKKDMLFIPSVTAFTNIDCASEESIKKCHSWGWVCYELRDTLLLETLCFLFVRFTQFYRWVAKGMSLRIEDYNFVDKCPADLENCVRMYDKRLKKNWLFADMGMRYNKSASKHSIPILFPGLNVDHKATEKFYTKVNGKYKTICGEPNYVFCSEGINELYNYLSPYKNAILEVHGFTLEAFMVFLHGLHAKYVSYACSELAGCLEYHNRAHLLVNIKENGAIATIAEVVSNNQPKNFKAELPDIENAIKYFYDSLPNDGIREIDLWTRYSKKFIYQIDPEWVVFDFTSLLYVINDLMRNIVKNSDNNSTIRSVDFENQLIKKLAAVFGQKRLWMCQKHIKGESGEKEIDASVIAGKRLLIFEAKALSMEPEYETGSEKQLKKRRDKLHKAMKEAREKIAFLQKEKDNLAVFDGNEWQPLAFPSTIQDFEPIVITNFTEYIWDMKPEKFLDKDKTIPRYLTIDEIDEIKELYLK